MSRATATRRATETDDLRGTPGGTPHRSTVLHQIRKPSQLSPSQLFMAGSHNPVEPADSVWFLPTAHGYRAIGRRRMPPAPVVSMGATGGVSDPIDFSRRLRYRDPDGSLTPPVARLRVDSRAARSWPAAHPFHGQWAITRSIVELSDPS